MNRNLMKYARAASIIAVIAVIAAEPAMAQAWATKTSSVLDQVLSGLKTLGKGIAAICIVFSAYSLIWGGKRVQDMVPFFIGAAVFIAGPELVDLFFGG